MEIDSDHLLLWQTDTYNHTAVLVFPLRDSHCKIVKCAVYRFKHLLDDSVIFEFWQKVGM